LAREPADRLPWVALWLQSQWRATGPLSTPAERRTHSDSRTGRGDPEGRLDKEW